MVAAASGSNPLPFAKTLDRAAKEVGVNFIGGYSALVHKGFAPGDRELIASIPEALATTERVCSSVNVGTTKAGINMDAVAMMGQVVRQLQRPRPTGSAWVRPNWWYSATPRRITPLWQVRFTAPENRTASSM